MTILSHIIASAEHVVKNNLVLGAAEHPDNFGSKYDTFHSIFPQIANYSFIAGIIIALVVALLLILCIRKNFQRISGTFLRYAFFIVWLYGFWVYDIGMCTGDIISLWTNAPMAFLYAFKIFLLDSDVSEIHEAFHGSWAYSFNFAVVHLLAAAVSTLFVVKYFWFNIESKFSMWKEGHLKKDVSFVFWGFNEASEKLMENIQSYYKKQPAKGSFRIILVRLNNDNDDNPKTRTGIGRIFDSLSISITELEKLQRIKCRTVGTYSNISNINITKDEDDILGISLSLRTLKRILEKKTRNKIHMLFLGEDEKLNLHAVSLLLKDESLKRFVDADSGITNREVIFYCHARYNSVHRVIEDRFMAGARRVKVIDSSHICVENLKLKEDLLPVNYVKVEKDATVSSSFNSLVIGFSEVGQDSVRFLYEYGAFVKTGSTDANVMRSDFRMHVVDKCMADVAGAFVANAPTRNVSVPFIKGMENADALITLNQMDCQSIEFYRNLENWIKDLNYIVVATDNDELNITLAVRIFKLAARYRKNLENFCILTRVHEDEDGHIREIAKYYNRLWKAQNAVKDYNGKIATQSVIKRDCDVSTPIHLFGLDTETYTYENIIDDSMEQQAVKFKERYTASIRENYKRPQSKDDYAWYVDIRENLLCIENDPQNNPTLSAVMGIRRTQGQDYANCFHRVTKATIARKALEEAGWREEFPWESLTRKFETLEYKVNDIATVPPYVFRILDVLAQTEHLRWNASHEMLGYVSKGDLPTRNEVRMHHSCIKNWQDLSPKIQSYDFDIVDMTLNIITPDRPIEK